MKVGVYHGPDDIRIEEASRPAVPDDGLLVAVRACGVCGTDVAKYRYKLVEPPVVLGHEVAGDVVAVGRQVTKWKPGDRVVVPHHIPCFVCGYCRHGNYSACPDFRANNIRPGGFAEYVSVAGPATREGVLPVPEGVSYDQAALCESLACCLRAFNRSAMRRGDSVAVVGCGPVGLMNMILARALGAGTVIALDVVPERLAAAKRFGAEVVLDAREKSVPDVVRRGTGGLGADIVLVCVGSVSAIETALAVARRGGQVHIFAECPPDSRLTLDPNLVYHELSIIGTYSSSPAELAEALTLIERGRVNVEALVTHRLPLDRLQEAFDLAVAGKEALKILIHP
jgi:L-iditol 2-dehydrogenase